MATQVTYWEANDGSQHDTEKEALDHELICKVADALYDASVSHHVSNMSRNDAMEAAEVLVMTDALSTVIDVLKDTEVLSGNVINIAA